MREFQMAVLIVADGLDFLRPCDVYRMLAEFSGDRSKLAEWVKGQSKNPAINIAIDEAMAEGFD